MGSVCAGKIKLRFPLHTARNHFAAGRETRPTQGDGTKPMPHRRFLPKKLRRGGDCAPVRPHEIEKKSRLSPLAWSSWRAGIRFAALAHGGVLPGFLLSMISL